MTTMKRSHLLGYLLAFLLFPSLLSAQCIAGDCTNGQGTFLYPSGAKYIGDFKGGRMHGQGICHYSDKSQYQGTWKNGYPDGQGTKTLLNGKEWKGLWRKGQPVNREGRVVSLVEAPHTYQLPKKMASKAAGEGCVMGNCENGYGTYIYRGHSAKYTGHFQRELPHGKGKIQYENGDYYEGHWSNGSFDGQGTLFLKTGKQVAGIWRNGSFAGATSPQRPTNAEQSFSSSTAPSKVWAVIIGVSSYNHMPTLKFTDDDAYRMYAFMKSPEGGALSDDRLRILIDEDATRNNILTNLNDVFSRAGSNDLVMLYFSGHGLQGSFLPNDFDGFNNKVLHEEINQIFRNSRAKYKICIADACHSGSLLAMKGTTTAKNALEKYYTTLSQAAPGTALILSSKSNETSLESSGLRQGVFSHFLIKGLKGEADANFDKIVTIQELYNYTESNVRSYTGNRQTPVIKGRYDRNMPAAVIR